MAVKERLLDVWLVELNQVYSGVPFTIVADWLQQGRVLTDDRVRMAGNQKWHAVGQVPALAPYLPRPEPLAAEDHAEALEPVELGLGHRRGGHDEEDDDVDMIPLIDISLVLLIFFMMTASVSTGAVSPIDTPSARNKLLTMSEEMYWVGVDVKSGGGLVEKGPDGRPVPWFSFGRESKQTVPLTLDLGEVTGAMAKELDQTQGEVKVRLRANRTLPIEAINGVTLELQALESRLNRGRGTDKLTLVILGEVSEPQSK